MSFETKWDIVVVGGANWDHLVRGPALPTPGGTVRGEDFQEAPGGKGANQAVAAMRLNASVAIIGRVGADLRGAQISERLARERVDVRFVVEDREAHTGIALVRIDCFNSSLRSRLSLLRRESPVSGATPPNVLRASQWA